MTPAPVAACRSRLARPAALLGLVMLAVTACSSSPQPGITAGLPPARIAHAKKLQVPARGALFGAWVQPPNGYSTSDEESAVAALERSLGRNLAINNVYVRWADPLPIALARWDLRRGTIPMISWNGANTRLIAAGAYDAQIRTRALQLKALHKPVLLRWFWEMDSQPNRKIVTSPASFIAAWRHVHDIFASVGATNVRWVWCPDSYVFATGRAQRYYPGNSYVDWIGADGYNWTPERPHTIYKSFQTIFLHFYQWGVATGKPLIVGEYGTVEWGAGAKAAWFRQVDIDLRTLFPSIRAVVYFDSDHMNFGKYFNWKVTSSPSAFAAFRALARDPYFSARPSL